MLKTLMIYTSKKKSNDLLNLFKMKILGFQQRHLESRQSCGESALFIRTIKVKLRQT